MTFCVMPVSVPLRGLWFEMLALNLYLQCTHGVSVPLRGLWFEIGGRTQVGRKRYRVSVPLRGLWFEIELIEKYDRLAAKFPSPCGVCGLKL